MDTHVRADADTPWLFWLNSRAAIVPRPPLLRASMSLTDALKRLERLENQTAMLREEVMLLRSECAELRLANSAEVQRLAAQFHLPQQQIEGDVKELRASLRRVAFDTFTTIVQRKIKDVQEDIEALRDLAVPGDFDGPKTGMAVELQQDVMGPKALDRVPAFTKLRLLHESRCPKCQWRRALPTGEGLSESPPCRMKAVILLARDLVVLSLLQEYVCSTATGLKVVYDKIAEGGTKWHILADGDRSLLSHAFQKIGTLGAKPYQEFAEEIRRETMFGPQIDDAEVEQVFLLYTDCSANHPYYRSKPKKRGNVRGRSGSPTRPREGSPTVGSTGSTPGAASSSRTAGPPRAPSMTRPPRACSADQPMLIELIDD